MLNLIINIHKAVGLISILNTFEGGNIRSRQENKPEL